VGSHVYTYTGYRENRCFSGKDKKIAGKKMKTKSKVLTCPLIMCSLTALLQATDWPLTLKFPVKGTNINASSLGKKDELTFKGSNLLSRSDGVRSMLCNTA